MSAPRASQRPSPPPGLNAREIAATVLEGVLRRRRSLDEQLDDQAIGLAALAERDRALVRHLVGTVLRRLGTLRHVLGLYLDRGFPADAPRVETALLLGAAQILLLQTPDHAAVDITVRLAQADRRAKHFYPLVNAVLRRVARDSAQQLDGIDTTLLDTPEWLMARWVKNYGSELARDITIANRQEPALDLSVKTDPAGWAEKLGGRVLPTGSVRVVAHGPVPSLPGFAEGGWWVQDAAAALPARLLGDVTDRTVADLCAAPGGKTAQLAAAGALVPAVDRAPKRLERLQQNLARLGLTAEVVAADVTQWRGGPFDAVLVDAPCSSTGTIRRHPDIPWLKSESDIAALADLQRRLLASAFECVKPGGILIYCTCSLEPEEGIEVVRDFLAREPRAVRRPIAVGEVGGEGDWLTPEGDLRTLPCQWPDADSRMAGLDGFFAARLSRI
jgi:16S rRNA (cytosine967-C5)-methyltransferase